MLTKLRSTLRFATYSLRAIGPGRLARHSIAMLRDRDLRAHDGGFDARFGTDTTTGMTPVEAEIPASRRDGATMYLPTMDQDLAAMLDALAWSDARRAEATFVDIGSGKGRVVMLAAMRRFREVVGVELSPVLHDVAARNLARVRPLGVLASPARLVLEDATTAEVPDGPVVIYLYHPFHRDLAARVLARIVASVLATPRPVAVIYGHPTLQPCLDRALFEVGGVLARVTEGGRATRHFRIGWSLWTNDAWLAARREAA